MSFPFPQLLAFLKEEKDQVEFMKIAAEVGLGPADVELAKLLLALQIYTAIYAAIPRQIKAVHAEAVGEIRHLRDQIRNEAERTSLDAAELQRWAKAIQIELAAVTPEALVKALHKRVLDESITVLSGTLQALAASYKRIETATQRMNAAADEAIVCIDVWQTITLRRVWGTAFLCCGLTALVAVILAVLWMAGFPHSS